MIPMAELLIVNTGRNMQIDLPPPVAMRTNTSRLCKTGKTASNYPGLKDENPKYFWRVCSTWCRTTHASPLDVVQPLAISRWTL